MVGNKVVWSGESCFIFQSQEDDVRLKANKCMRINQWFYDNYKLHRIIAFGDIGSLRLYFSIPQKNERFECWHSLLYIVVITKEIDVMCEVHVYLLFLLFVLVVRKFLCAAAHLLFIDHFDMQFWINRLSKWKFHFFCYKHSHPVSSNPTLGHHIKNDTFISEMTSASTNGHIQNFK